MPDIPATAGPPPDAAPPAVASGAARRRWLVFGGLAVVVVALAAVVLAVFQPQTLLFDRTVDEAPPVGGASGPQVTARGAFLSLDHPTSGDALALDADGATYVRLENLETDNGPDLKVYLSTLPATTEFDDLGPGAVLLGDLKGNVGNQNYPVPTGVDPADFASVVIWCERFSVGFGVAGLL